MSMRAQRAIDLAVSYAPMREVGDNAVFCNDHIASPWFGFQGEWCDAFVSSVMEQAGALEAAGGRYLYTPAHYERLQDMGREVDKADAQTGDIVFFDWDFARGAVTQHVGFARGPVGDRGTLPTVEGNTSSGEAGSQYSGGGVYLRERGTTGIRGVFRPEWPDGDPGRLTPLLGAGCRGERVKAVQRVLKLETDGVFGPATREAVKAWQAKSGKGLHGEDVRHAPLRGEPTGYLEAATYAALVGKKPSSKKPQPLALDGLAGPKTWARARALVNASSDFWLVYYLQDQLNKAGYRDWSGRKLRVDGYGLTSNTDGPTERTRTGYAFSKAMGVKNPTGVMDKPSDTYREWQERLNAGRVL